MLEKPQLQRNSRENYFAAFVLISNLFINTRIRLCVYGYVSVYRVFVVASKAQLR